MLSLGRLLVGPGAGAFGTAEEELSLGELLVGLGAGAFRTGCCLVAGAGGDLGWNGLTDKSCVKRVVRPALLAGRLELIIPTQLTLYLYPVV